MKAHIGATIKAHLLRSTFHLLLLLAVCVIPLALAQRTTWGAPANIITVTNLNDNGAGTAMQSEAKCSFGLDLSVLPYALAVPRIRGQPACRFRKYKELKKFSVRLVNSPQQIWRGSTVANLHLQKWL